MTATTLTKPSDSIEKSTPYLEPFNDRWDSVIFIHCQKTGGSAVNHAFYEGLIDEKDQLEFERNNAHDPLYGSKTYRESTLGRRITKRLNRSENRTLLYQKTLITKSKKIANTRGFTFFSGHTPIEDLLPIKKKCFVFTILRDPLDRLISRYRMDYYLADLEGGLMHYDREHFRETIHSPEDYFKLLKSEYRNEISHQLSCFSKNNSVSEALENLNKCNAVLNYQDLEKELYDKICKEIDLKLKIRKVNSYDVNLPKITNSVKSRLEKDLELEIQFYKTACKYYFGRT